MMLAKIGTAGWPQFSFEVWWPLTTANTKEGRPLSYAPVEKRKDIFPRTGNKELETGGPNRCWTSRPKRPPKQKTAIRSLPKTHRLHHPFSPRSLFISPPPRQEEGKGTGQPITNKTDTQQEKKQREQPPQIHHLSLSRMAPRLAFLLLLLAVACVTNSSALNAVGSDAPVGLADFLGARGDGGLTESTRTCDDLLGQCADEDQEMETETGISRRGLAAAGKRFISYGALSKNKVPCNRRGQSYYNCSRGKQANPYRRGCSVITQCQRIFN